MVKAFHSPRVVHYSKSVQVKLYRSERASNDPHLDVDRRLDLRRAGECERVHGDLPIRDYSECSRICICYMLYTCPTPWKASRRV